MTLAIADLVALAIEAGPQPCEAHQVVTEPKGSAVLREEDRCGKPGTALHLIGCVHEHVIELWMCPACVKSPAFQYCGECFDKHGQVCPVLVTPAAGGDS